MGDFFGEGHYDEGDEEAGMTIGYQDGTIPQSYEPGRFHLFYLGVYIVTSPLQFIAFSGLRKHGGSPPLAPEGMAPDPYAYRLMHILYPPSAMLSGAGVKRIGLASIPGSQGAMELLTIPPEMTTPL